MEARKCQLQALPSMHQPLSKPGVIAQFLQHRLRRMLKRRLGYALNIFRSRTRPKQSTAGTSQAVPYFQPGERIRVKAREEIAGTLDAWNERRGCGFMDEMWAYCGTEQTIFKPVKRFLDERDYRVKHVRGRYLLEGLICEGTRDFGPCDRSCFYFWDEAWLEKVAENRQRSQ